MAPTQVTIGQHSVIVPAQPVPVVCDILGVEDLGELFAGGDPMDNLRERFQGKAYFELYAILCEFIPQLGEKMPVYEWGGYASQEAMDSKQRDRDSSQKAPNGDQILEAIETIVVVNGGARLGKLLDLVQTVQGLGASSERA